MGVFQIARAWSPSGVQRLTPATRSMAKLATGGPAWARYSSSRSAEVMAGPGEWAHPPASSEANRANGIHFMADAPWL